MKFLVLQHINIEHPGIFLKFKKEDNIQLDTIELDENEKIPNPDKYDAMIVAKLRNIFSLLKNVLKMNKKFLQHVGGYK